MATDGIPLPGGIGVSKLTVYRSPAPDGLVGGSAHVHLACTEGYVVVGGRGRVQTLNAAGFREIPLREGAVVWFSPGTIHRLVNEDGELEIVTLMQNAGLPEAGDAVLTFPPPVLADLSRYATAAAVDGDGGAAVSRAEERRDLAIEGFRALRDRFEQEGPSALDPFYDRAAALVQHRIPVWRQLWKEHGARVAADTARWFDALEQGDPSYLREARVEAAGEPAETAFPGMCGTLATYRVPGDS